MCLLCSEIQKERMTIKEVARAYREMVLPEDHLSELMYHIERSYGIEEVAEELVKLSEEEESK